MSYCQTQDCDHNLVCMNWLVHIKYILYCFYSGKKLMKTITIYCDSYELWKQLGLKSNRARMQADSPARLASSRSDFLNPARL